jgi:transcriptional regulator with XRE-family HTH domain
MSKKPTYAQIVRRLRELTSINSGHPRNLSQGRFGEMCGFGSTQSRISNYENGRRKPSDQDYVAMIRVAGIPTHVASGLAPEALLAAITSRILKKKASDTALERNIDPSNQEGPTPQWIDLYVSETKEHSPKKNQSNIATDWITELHGEFLFDRYLGEFDHDSEYEFAVGK